MQLGVKGGAVQGTASVRFPYRGAVPCGRGRNSPCGGAYANGLQNTLRCDGRCNALHVASQRAASAIAACCAFRAAVLFLHDSANAGIYALSLRVTSIILPLFASGSSSFSSVSSPFSFKPFPHHLLAPLCPCGRQHPHISQPLACLCANLFVTLPAEMPPFAQSMPRH